MGVFKQITKNTQTIGGSNMINIIYNNEVIDTANDITEALYIKKEYELAFHTTGIELEMAQNLK